MDFFNNADKLVDANDRIDRYNASRPWMKNHWRNHTGTFATKFEHGFKHLGGYIGTGLGYLFGDNEPTDDVAITNSYLRNIGEQPIQNVSDLDERIAYNYSQGRDWTNRINRSARPYKNVPSAVTSRDGIKNDMSKTNKKKKTIKQIRKRKVKNVARKQKGRFLKGMNARTGTPSYAQRRMMSRLGNIRGKGKVRFGARNRALGLHTVPMAMGRSYTGYQGAMLSKQANCINYKSRMYMGTIQCVSGTDRKGNTGVNVNPWVINGTNDCFGQFFFGPGNLFYNTLSGNYVEMAHMFTKYRLNNVSFTFESMIMPGNTTQTRVNYGFFDNVDYGMSAFGSGSYDAGKYMTKSDVMGLPTSKNFPAWEPTVTVSPPPRYYRGAKREIISLDNTSALTFSEVHASTNNLFYAFGMWIYIDHGAVNMTALNVCDVFMNVDIDFCDMVPHQSYDASGSSTLLKVKAMPIEHLDKVQEVITARKAHAEFERKTNREIAKQWDELEQPVDLKRQDVVFDQLKLTDFETEYIQRVRKMREAKRLPVRDIEDGPSEEEYDVISKNFRSPGSIKSDYGDVKPLSDNKVKSSSNK